MTKFTYWRLKETYISGAYIPENYRQSLRGILEKGVTVWHDPMYMTEDDPMAENVPVDPKLVWL